MKILAENVNCKKLLISLVLLSVLSSLSAQNIDRAYVSTINKYIDFVNKTAWGVSQNYFIFSDGYNWSLKEGEKVGDKFKRHSFIGVLKSKYSDSKEYSEISLIKNKLDDNHQKIIQIADSIHLIYKEIIDYSYLIRGHLVGKLYLNDNFTSFYKLIDESRLLYRAYHLLYKSFRKEIHKIALRILNNDPHNQHLVMEMNMREALDYQLELLYKWSDFMNGGDFPEEAMKQNAQYTDKELLHYEKTPDINPHVRFHYKRFYSYLNIEHQRFKKKYLEDYKNNRLESDRDFVIYELISAFNIRCVREHDLYVKNGKGIAVHILKYNMQPYLFIKDAAEDEIPVVEKADSVIEFIDENIEELYKTMDGYAVNNLVLLLDVSASMNSPKKIHLLKKSFKRLLKILRKEDMVSIVVYSGTATIVLEPTSCAEKEKIVDILDNLKSGGSTNFTEGLQLAFSSAIDNFIDDGNNRILLATDGQFKIDKSLFKQTKKQAKNDVFLSVFHFGAKQNNNQLLKLASEGNGNYEFIDEQNVALKLIKEAKAIRKK